MDDKQKVLLKSLYSAFPTLPTVKPREMFPRHPYHDIERQDIANTIGNVEWDRIPSSILKAEYAALHFFLHDAFIYYLPAYLRLVILDINSSGMIPETLVSCLSPHKARKFCLFTIIESRVDWLNNVQCKIVLEVLFYIKSYWKETEDYFGIGLVIGLVRNRLCSNGRERILPL